MSLASLDGAMVCIDWALLYVCVSRAPKTFCKKNRFESMSSSNPQSVAVISRRELLKRGGKGAAAAAVSSVFLPFALTGKAAVPKTLSFWQFYAPAKQVGTQSKWFEDCVKGWNATHDVKVELQFVPVQDYIGGSKLQTAFAAGQGPGYFHHQLRGLSSLLQWRRSGRPHFLHG